MKPAERKVEKKPSGKKFDKRDDLMAIAGIGPALAKKLNAEGILSYKQLAALSNEDVANLDPKFKGRIKRDDWVGQAKKLSQE
jgi:predicted flap endonuclease-1-like 5' DNA nuclease